MAEARPFRWLHPALLVALVVLASAAVRGSSGGVADRPLNAQLAAAVSWPTSQGLVVAEVVTGAASASDELIEVYNAGAAAADLAGLEIVYVTASGSTITRKQTWTAVTLAPGRHLLLANSAGKWAASADGLYTGGLAATGGSLALRVVGGSVIDSLSWGDTTSSFVEGAAGPAPAAGSSLERKPGGQSGNSVDTNDNLADTRIEISPIAQSLVSEPVPAPAPTQNPTPTLPQPTIQTTASPPPTSTPSPTEPPEATEPCTPEPSASPSPSASPTSTPTPSASPTPTPTETPSPLPTTTPALSPSPTEAPSPFPTEASPPSSPTPTSTPSATPSPPPTPVATPTPSLGSIRQLPVGTRVQVAGRLTTPTGLLGGGTLAFIEDATAGIALGLDSADWAALTAGTDVRAQGILLSRDHLLMVVLDAPGDISPMGSGPLPDPLIVATGLACEPFEARLIAVEGWVSHAPASLGGGGFAAVIDDGTGPLSVVVANATEIAPEEIVLGSRLRLTGILSQRDQAGTGAGYELLLRSIDDVVLISAPPTPTPTPSPWPTPTPPTTATPTASPTASSAPTASPPPTSSPTPAPTPTASPSPAPSPMSISVARSRSIGSVVRVRGVVTVGPGWILGDSTIALQDATAGIFVRLPDPGVAGIVPGRVLEVEGALATPYGNLELRPVSTAVRVLEMGSQPSPRTLTVAELGEETEGLIARISATVIAIESSTSGSLTLIVEDASGEGRVFMHAPLGLTHDDFSVGERIAAIGLVGDRLGLYRLWPRNQSDTAIVPGDPTPTPTSHATPTPTPHATPTPTAHPSPSPTGHGTPSPSPTTSPGSGGVIGIADALRRQGQQVTIEGTVTTRPGLLDTDGARVTVQDSTAAILIRLPGDAAAQLGQRLRISGEVGTYYGAPQLTATTATRTADGSASPISVRSAPIGAGLEWRLVTVTGAIESVHRDGESWRAEINLAGGSVPIVGLSRSGIESTALVAGRTATVTGIAKRAYPTASDQRFAVVPRTAADINLGSAPGNGSPAPSGGPGSGTATPRPTSRAAPGPSHTAGTGIGTGAGPGGTPGAAPGAPTTWNGKTVVALADLAAHETETVAVGGVVEGIDGTRIVVNDGTGTATIRFLGDALPMIGLFGQGDMLNALGTVERVATGGLELAVSDPANVARLAPIAVSPGETAGRGPEATQLDQANAQVTATGAASTAIIAAVLLTLAMAVAAAAILAVPSTRNVLRERGRRLSESLRRWIVQLRSS